MPPDWSQRMRELKDMPKNRETLAKLAESAPLPERFRQRAVGAPPPASPLRTNVEFAPPVVSEIPSRPITVRIASLSLLCAAALTLALAGFGIAAIYQLRDTFDNALQLDHSGAARLMTADYADETQTALVIAAIALGVVLAIVYVFVAWAIWRGRHWPRWVSPVLAVLSLPALLLGHIAIVAVAAGVTAAAVLWMPSARSYATRRRAHVATTRAIRRGVGSPR